MPRISASLALLSQPSKKSHVLTSPPGFFSAFARTQGAVMDLHAASTFSLSLSAETSGWMHRLRREERHTARMSPLCPSSCVRCSITRFSSSTVLVISGTVRVQYTSLPHSG